MTPTILLFLKAPVAGAVKTRLAAEVGEAEALRIYRWLAERQVAAIPAGWPVEIHHAPAEAGAAMVAWLGEAPGRSYWPQPDRGLGERLTAATRAAFARGASAVLLIGGDCADLDAALLRAAAQALEEYDAVLGPAVDGGYYLLGMRARYPTLLTGVPWSTAEVAAVTRQRLAAAGLRWAELPELHDIDTAQDWRHRREQA